LIMFACANFLNCILHPSFCHHPPYVSLGLFVKLYDECFCTYVNALYDDMGIFLQSCVNMVFRHDWRPTSFSFICLAILLNWIVYKLCNAPYLSYTMKSCSSWDKHGVLTLVNKLLW
jgi:hypothetical protein